MGVIVCDSACDLWKDQIQELGVKVITIPYSVNGEEQIGYLQTPEEIDEFYDKLRKGAVSATSLINEFVLEEYFDKLLAQGEDVLFIHFSSALTATFNVMQNVVDKLLLKYPDRKFLVVDTLQVTMGVGIHVYQAAKMYKKGKTFEEIKKYLEDLKMHIACYFGVDDLMYLRRGGRISAAAAIGGTLLGIKAILRCDEHGKIVKVGTVKGRKGIVTKLASYITSLGDKAAEFPIIITHSGNEQGAKMLQEEVYKIVGQDANVWIQPIGAIIGTHCGPDTVAITFRAKHR